MGATEVSTRENYLEQAMQKSDFPKLKTSELIQEDLLKSKASAPVLQAEKQTNVTVWIGIGLLTAQFILFLITLGMLHSSSGGSTPQKEIQVTEIDRNISKPAVRAAKKGPISSASIQVANDEVSRRALMLSFNQKILRVNYLVKPHSEEVYFEVKLPRANISELKGIGFSLRNQPSDDSSPQILVVFRGANNKTVSLSVNELFSFWKKYEFDLDADKKEILENQITGIEFHIKPTSENQEGTFYLDNLSFT